MKNEKKVPIELASENKMIGLQSQEKKMTSAIMQRATIGWIGMKKSVLGQPTFSYFLMVFVAKRQGGWSFCFCILRRKRK